VKKITLTVLLFLSAHAWAGGDPTPDEYTINIHVSSSNHRLCRPARSERSHRTYAQDLNGWREAEGMSRLGPLEIL
jgi:hypothetical protein